MDRAIIDPEVLLAVSKKHYVNLEQYLSHELSPVPLSQFSSDLSTRNTNKADLTKKLEVHVQKVHQTGNPEQKVTAHVVDGMALIQTLNDAHFEKINEL